MASSNDENFVDILDDRRKSSDIAWASRKWECPSCRYSQCRTPEEIAQEVMSSTKVQNVIKEVSDANGQPEETVRSTAESIVDEMAHSFSMKAIRFFGFVLSKLMKRLYSSIIVNKKGLEKIASVSSQFPILYLPTHRSYADFLLVSYICFYYNLPIPAIAAGVDFLGLKMLNFLLRSSGAFFIRRSFVGDRLYWTIFSEYVQSHIQGCEFPLEFFIEGTRSRTAKSLVPKLGMLQAIMEKFFTSQIPDIIVIPISISYDRTLEEMLYAYELLGVPKPKESTKGLFKARKILSEHFGNVSVFFGEPISVRHFFRNYDRSIHNLHPRCMSVVTKEEQMLCRDLANHVIHMQQCNLLLSAFPLICLVLGHPLYSSGVHKNELADLVFWLEELVKRTGASVVSGNLSVTEIVDLQVNLHSNIICMSPENIISVKQDVHKQYAVSADVRLQSDILVQAVPQMFIYHYENQALQLLVHMCMVCMAITGDKNTTIQQDVFYRYTLLRKLLSREFVFERLKEEKDFAHAVQSLCEERVLSVHGMSNISVENIEKANFLSVLLHHFLQCYFIICHHLLVQNITDATKCQTLVWQCQKAVEYAITKNILFDYKCLSLDIVNNCVAFLVSQNCIHKIQRNDQIVMRLYPQGIRDILMDIEMFLPPSFKELDTFVDIPSAKL